MSDSFDLLGTVVLDSNSKEVCEGQIVSMAGEIAIAIVVTDKFTVCRECCFSDCGCRASVTGFNCYDVAGESMSFRKADGRFF